MYNVTVAVATAVLGAQPSRRHEQALDRLAVCTSSCVGTGGGVTTAEPVAGEVVMQFAAVEVTVYFSGQRAVRGSREQGVHTTTVVLTTSAIQAEQKGDAIDSLRIRSLKVLS